MQILIDGLMLDGTDNSRAIYTIERDGVQGLFGGPGVKGQQESRPLAHGDFSLPQFREARIITVTGLVCSSSVYEQGQHLTALAGVFADGREGSVSVLSEIGARTFTARLADAPMVKILAPGRVAEYQLALRASDPRLYGEFRTVSGSSVQVVNYGNFPASPVVEVVGPRSAPYTITGPGGRTVVVSQALTAGQTHRIDFASGGLYRNGARQIGGISVFKPWTIPANGQAAMSISAGSMNVTVTDTYM